MDKAYSLGYVLLKIPYVLQLLCQKDKELPLLTFLFIFELNQSTDLQMDVHGTLELLYFATVRNKSISLLQYFSSIRDFHRAFGSFKYLHSHFVRKAKFVSERGVMPNPPESREFVTFDQLTGLMLFFLSSCYAYVVVVAFPKKKPPIFLNGFVCMGRSFKH